MSVYIIEVEVGRVVMVDPSTQYSRVYSKLRVKASSRN